jgi:cytochrome c biogenesis protein CcdA
VTSHRFSSARSARRHAGSTGNKLIAAASLSSAQAPAAWRTSPGQFGLGLQIGAVCSPCVGPTLGAASVLAARDENLTEVAGIMVASGMGAGLLLALFGLASQATLARSRQRMLQAGRTGKIVLGITLMATGLAVLTGLDKRAEAALLGSMPRWLVELTTRY